MYVGDGVCLGLYPSLLPFLPSSSASKSSPLVMDTAHMSIQLYPTEQPLARPHSHSPSSIISNPSRNPTPSSNITSPMPSATSSIDFPSSISPYSTSPFAIDANGMNPVEPDTPSDLDSPSAQATNQPSDVDPQILEALRSKDRIYVLKLGELMEGLIKERRYRSSSFSISFVSLVRLTLCQAKG